MEPPTLVEVVELRRGLVKARTEDLERAQANVDIHTWALKQAEEALAEAEGELAAAAKPVAP